MALIWNDQSFESRPFTLAIHFFAALVIVNFSLAPATAQEQPRSITPSESTSGALLLNSSTPGKYVEAPALVTDVAIEISGPIARTKVTQRFENTTDNWVEGVYVFPLPDKSAVDTLRMQIGDRFIEGRIEERKKAKAIFEAAKAAGQKTSLLEQERPNIFTNSVANIGPGETIVVQIEYQESLSTDNGVFSLRFPMVVAPRYNPAPQIVLASLDGQTGWAISDPVPDRSRIEPPVRHPDLGEINPVYLSVSLDAGFPIGELNSAYHEINVERPTETSAHLTLADGATPANRDFKLSWSSASKSSPSAALFTETIDSSPYYLLMVTPPALQSDLDVANREITFILDTSGSMGGASIRQAQQSLMLAIKRLKTGDTFNVIEFNSTTHPLFNRPQPVTPAAVGRALTWVEGLQARGGTNMLPALNYALAQENGGDGRLRQIIFLTDGAIGNEQALFETISTNRGDARIFTVGIGSAPNSFFMSRAAEIGRGTFTHIGVVSEVAEQMGVVFEKLESPVITDISIEWPDGAIAEMWPSPVPDIYKGETLKVAARANTTNGVAWVTGTTNNQPWKVGLPLENAATRTGVSKLWARQKIASLELDRARHRDEREDLDSRILTVALAHKLVSRLTSLVAVDVTPSRPESDGLTQQSIPLNLPHGWDFESVFGPDVVVGNRNLPAGSLKTTPQFSETDSAQAATHQPHGVILPQTSTLADVKIFAGLLLLVAALMLFLRARQRVKLTPC